MEEFAALLKTLKHASSSEGDQSALWLRLTEVLSSAWALKQGLSLGVPLSFPVYLSSALRTADRPLQRTRAAECLHALLALPVASVLLAQLDTVARLLSAVMEFAVDILSGPDGHLSKELCHTLVLMVSHFSSVVDRHGNAKKVFNSIVSVLEPYAVLRWSLHHQGPSEGVVVGGDDLIRVLDQVPTSLFAEECLAELQHYLSIDGEGKRKQKKATISYTEGVFTRLSSCGGKNWEALTHFLPHLFRLFLARNQKVKVVKKHCEFGLLVKFGALLGFHGDLKAGACHVTHQFMECSAEEQACALLSLSECLLRAGDYGVYLATEDSGVQLKWLQALCGCLITKEVGLGIIAGLYPCLSALLQLNHLSIEPFLPAIWTKVLDQDKLDPSCEEFCIIVIATYSKLHQLHWLLEMVLQGAVESKSTRLNRIFPGAVEVEFERALSATPPGQCSDILNWLCGLVEEVCVCPLSTLTSAEGPPKKKKRRSSSSSSAVPLLPDHQHVVLVRVCDVVCQVLCHLPVDTWQGRTAGAAQQGLRRMTVEGAMELVDMAVKQPPGSKENVTAATCALLVLYGVYKLSHVLRSTVADSVSLLEVTSDDLSGLAVSPLCKHLIGQIALLDVLSCQLPCEAGVHQLMQVPKPSHVEAQICSASWNGEALSVSNDGSSLVSSWQLTLHALPHVWSAVSTDELCDIAALIVKVLTTAVRGRHSRLHTMLSVTVEFLGSAVFQVMDALHSRLVGAAVEDVRHLLHHRSRFDKSFRRLIRSVLKLGMNDEKEEVDLSGLLVMGGEVKGVCPPLTEEELEQWVIILRGVVELIMFLPLHGIPLDTLRQVTAVVMATDILAFKLLQAPLCSGRDSLQCVCDVRTLLAHAVRCEGSRGVSPPWFLDVLLKWMWFSAPPMERTDEPSPLLLASVCVGQSILQVTPETELGRLVQLVFEDLLQLDKTSHHLMLKALVHQCCNRLSQNRVKRKQVASSASVAMVTHLTAAIRSCDSHTDKELLSHTGRTRTEAVQLVLGSLLSSVLQLPCSSSSSSSSSSSNIAKDTPERPISHLVNSVTSLSQLATSCLESWSLSDPHSMDEKELVLDSIDVLCLPSLVGSNEVIAMEKGVEPWSTLLRFMNKMFTNGSSEAERCVFDFKVANIVSTLVQHAQRSQLKEMFTHTFDVGASDGWSEHYRVVFLRIWSMILAITALPTDGRKEVRRWMSRVAITTVEMVGASVTREEVLKGALDVLHKLANFPDHVGMDKQTAVLVVHGLSIVQIKESKQLLHWGSALLFGKQLARILLSLWRNYEKIVLTNFVSFMAVVRKILLIIGSELREGPSNTKLLEECCSHFVLVAEQIGRRKKLAKFAPYLILDALNMIQQGPAPPLIEQLLSSGVYTLLDVCGENDMVFLKASLDPSYRDLFSTLLTNYSKHHKFTGQV